MVSIRFKKYIEQGVEDFSVEWIPALTWVQHIDSYVICGDFNGHLYMTKMSSTQQAQNLADAIECQVLYKSLSD